MSFVMKTLIFALTLALLAISPVNANSAELYGEYRQKLAFDGWEPAKRTATATGDCFDYPNKPACDIYPEAVDCSGTGVAYCTMKWVRGNETKIVITAGEIERKVVEIK